MGVSGPVWPAGRRRGWAGPGAGPPEPAAHWAQGDSTPAADPLAESQGCRLRRDGPLPLGTGI